MKAYGYNREEHCERVREANSRMEHGNYESEACKLLEVGFEYVTDIDGVRIFRKRK